MDYNELLRRLFVLQDTTKAMLTARKSYLIKKINRDLFKTVIADNCESLEYHINIIKDMVGKY